MTSEEENVLSRKAVNKWEKMLKFRGKKLAVIAGVFTVMFILYRMSSSETELSTDDNRYSALNSENVRPVSGVKQSWVHEPDDLTKEPKDPSSSVKTKSSKQSSVKKAFGQGVQFPGHNVVPLFPGQRIVHLDLKGAPPVVSYYEEFFPLIRSLGATGLLIEYEDMFPYSRKELSALNAYSKSDIARILQLAADNELDIIPLIQTFGHMEFVLKLKQYKHLREVPKYPQVICPSKNSSLSLVKEMIDDVMALHRDIKYFHIGCDEVYNLGECYKCVQTMVKERWTKQQLFLNHVTTVARYIREKYPKVTVLTWDDEFRKVTLQELTESGIGALVEPVVWKYTPTIESFLPDLLWDKYATAFNCVWIATAFKGATGPDKYTIDIAYHLENHRSWMKLVAMYSDQMRFKGAILTGWQRYDHFAVLCELLPIGIPSLAVNLAYISSNNISMHQPPDGVYTLLKCGPGLMKMKVGSKCGFPGAGVYETAVRLLTLTDQIKRMEDGSNTKGWFTTYNIEMRFASPSHVEAATFELDRCKMELIYIEQDMTKYMSEVFDQATVKEWLATYIKPLHKTLQTMWDAKEKLLQVDEWPQRPLHSVENRDL